MGGLSVTRMGADVNTWYRKVASCRHERTASVISDGLEREICEGCGNVTIRYESVIDGSLDRGVFARDADKGDHPAPQKRRWPAKSRRWREPNPALGRRPEERLQSEEKT